MPFVYDDPKTGLPDTDRWNLVIDRWERMMRRRLDGALIIWWGRLGYGQRNRIEIAGHGVLILLLLLLL